MNNKPSNVNQLNTVIKQEVGAVPKQSDKIKLFATIFPMEVKIILSFNPETLISEVKNYIQDSVRALNIGGFYIGKITNVDDYLFLNNQKLGDLVSNNELVLVYSKDYKICEKTLAGKKNPNWYGGEEPHKKRLHKIGNANDDDDDKTAITVVESNQEDDEYVNSNNNNNNLPLKEGSVPKSNNSNRNSNNNNSNNNEFKKPVKLGNNNNNHKGGQNNNKGQGNNNNQNNNHNQNQRKNNNNNNNNNGNSNNNKQNSHNNSSKKGNSNNQKQNIQVQSISPERNSENNSPTQIQDSDVEDDTIPTNVKSNKLYVKKD
jgi:hypothetical protein